MRYFEQANNNQSEPTPRVTYSSKGVSAESVVALCLELSLVPFTRRGTEVEVPRT